MLLITMIVTRQEVSRTPLIRSSAYFQPGPAHSISFPLM